MSLVGAALLCALGAGCSSTTDYRAAYREALTEASTAIDSGRMLDAQESALALITEIEANGVEGYEAQRALVNALLVRLHAEASESSAFLMEPGAIDLSKVINSGVGTSDADDRVRKSVTAHRLAAVFHAGHLLQSTGALGGADEPGVLAPDSLQPFLEPQFANTYSWLVASATLAELGFRDQAAEILTVLEHPTHGQVFAQTSDLRADRTMLEVLDEYRIPQHLQWQLLVVAHEHHRDHFESLERTTNPTLAYRLGCLAAFGRLRQRDGGDLMEHTGQAVDQDWSDSFQLWVSGLREQGAFLSTSSTPFGGGVTVCESSGEPVVDFQWTPADR